MFENLTLGQIAGAIATIGIICAFLFKIFSAFNQIKENKEALANKADQSDVLALKESFVTLETAYKLQKEDLQKTVDETNAAVNLLCMALSALIDNQLTDNANKDELRLIKQRLDEKKEIV